MSSTANRTTREPPTPFLLVNGDRMTQAEFHRRYLAYPDGKQFELVGGTVYMASPVSWLHGAYHSELNLALGLYQAGTPGVELGDSATTILGEESEPQPDLVLRIPAEFGGQSELKGKYVVGAPELHAEVACSSHSIDLHQKRDDYQKAGVREYLVLCIEEQELHWFDFAAAEVLAPDRQGTYRSRVFPGLWVSGPALLARDSARLQRVVRRGLASPEHAAFAKCLRAPRRRHGRK
jgi:hypothetical protein